MIIGEIVHLELEQEDCIHPYAAQVFNKWKADLKLWIPQLSQLSIEEINTDIDTYLTADEKISCASDLTVILQELAKCTDANDDISAHIYAAQIVIPCFRVNKLLSKAYERKANKMREEQKKREDEENKKAEEQRLRTALKSLAPPFQSAKDYLNTEEYKAFVESIPGAVNAYLSWGKAYHEDSRSQAYIYHLQIINNRIEAEKARIRNRQEERERKTRAESRARGYNQLLIEEMTGLKSVLYSKKQDIKRYFKKHVKDARYTGDSFAYMLPGDAKRNIDSLVKERLDKKMTSEFDRFLLCQHTMHYFLLPVADYILENIPCLNVSFDVFSVTETSVWLKPEQININGFDFTLPWIEHQYGNYGSAFVQLSKAKCLGFRYQVFTPSDLGFIFWQTIPLVLILSLARGDSELSGITITGASESTCTYRINGFEREVIIPNDFASYLREIGSIDEMVSVRIIDQRVADIIKRRISELESGQEVFTSENKRKRKYSRKDESFSLFDELKQPSDPELRALGLKNETLYRYHQEWKKKKSKS